MRYEILQSWYEHYVEQTLKSDTMWKKKVSWLIQVQTLRQQMPLVVSSGSGQTLWEESDEENIWTQEGGSKRRMENIAQWEAA
jgi:hypothetical protein